jgi:hypothetical protein
MAEPGDYAPAPWAAQTTFAQARAAYDQHAGRSYSEAKAAGKKARDMVPESISTKSTHPLTIRVDVSGSMSDWPAPIFEKMGYMDHELRTEYLGEDMEVSFGAFCDIDDEYPFQVRDFAKGKVMQEALKALIPTGGGAGPGQYCESHSVVALYDVRNATAPNAVITPPYIFVTDEMPYDVVNPREADDIARVKLTKSLSAANIFEALKGQYSAYVILKPYSGSLQGDRLDSTTEQVYAKWRELLGADRIALLPEARRIVDVIFGILARETGRVDYFRKEIEARQQPGQVKTVYKALETVHALLSGARSVKRLPPGSSQLRSRKP